MSLFQIKDFKSAAGLNLTWKIECDDLAYDDWATIAMVGSKRLPPFGTVVGVPTGGWELERHMKRYITKNAKTTLIVDDVYTTGKSIREYMAQYEDVFGFVAFARAELSPDVACFARIYA